MNQAKNDAHRDTRRRFEQWAKNPLCQANVLSAVHNVPMADVAQREGGTATMGQSPFAIARGRTFEATLLRNGAEVLLTALKKAGVLPEGAGGFKDLRSRMNGGPCRDLDDSRSRTSALFADIASGQSRDRPAFVAGATVQIPGGIMLPEAILVLDALVLRYDARPTLMVGEIKTYPDRGGHTDLTELATARAQAGVYVHGLDLVLEKLDLASAFTVAREGFLVLSRPGFNQPSIRAGEDLRYQAERAKRGFQRLRDAAAQLPPIEVPARYDAIAGAATEYCEACVAFCDRADLCRSRALASGDPAVLGDDVARFLGAVSLPRTIELMNGAAPANPAESDLARRVRELEALRSQS
jgi:hypothetical protein